jgi:TPP-dependent indolepyruvate ferredoxin oxidoreductase alpha subunit
MKAEEVAEERNPMEDFLRMDRIPHIWCPGCGIGTVVTSFTEALKKSELDLNKVAVVSGIGCTGRVAGYVKFDSFHSTHGRAIPFATGLKLANPELKVIVFSGDGDIAGIGGNHLIHAARRNMDIVVICVNNFNSALTVPGRYLRRHLRGPLDSSPYTKGNQVHTRGIDQEGILFYRSDHPLRHSVCPAEQIGRWLEFAQILLR